MKACESSNNPGTVKHMGGAKIGKTVVFGDVGGHFDVFRNGLAHAGVDLENRVVPEGLQVIQVGDLVHKGPHGNEAVELAGHLLNNSGGRYMQLMGNHEAQYCGGEGFWRDDTLDRKTIETLQNWWYDTGQMQVAVSVETPGQTWLVSHAGCTVNRWKTYCKGSGDAKQVAKMLNDLAHENPGQGLSSGWMLRTLDGRNEISFGKASCVWAHPAKEAYAKWEEQGEGWGQIHGHVALAWWSGDLRVDPAIKDHTTLDPQTRVTKTIKGHRTMLGVDPGWGQYTSLETQPYLTLGG